MNEDYNENTGSELVSENIENVGVEVSTPQKSKRSNGVGRLFLGMILGMLLASCIILITIVVVLGPKSRLVIGGLPAANNTSVSGEESANSAKAQSKTEALRTIINKYYYLDRNVDPAVLDDGMYHGMVDALGDPYSAYYSAEELKNLQHSNDGTYYGIGAYVSMDDEYGLPKISSVMADSPAEKAGIRANDILYMADDTSLYGLTLDEAVSLIKGPLDTEVRLTIYRDGEMIEMTLTRGKVDSPSVSLKMKENNIAYIAISNFYENTDSQFATAMEEARANGMTGLILDLRGNPGGYLDVVCEIAREILPKGIIVYTEDSLGKRVDYTCDGSKELDVPMVVLIDINSASASEVLSGAIKDYGIGTLVGTTTFGKGIVQEVIPLSDGSAIKITTSAYYSPLGHNIHGTGITPDVECPFDSESYYREEDPVDNQLQKALELINRQISQNAE